MPLVSLLPGTCNNLLTSLFRKAKIVLTLCVPGTSTRRYPESVQPATSSLLSIDQQTYEPPHEPYQWQCSFFTCIEVQLLHLRVATYTETFAYLQIKTSPVLLLKPLSGSHEDLQNYVFVRCLFIISEPGRRPNFLLPQITNSTLSDNMFQ